MPPNISLGNFLFIANASAYGLYMIYVKPLSEKYNTIHLLKWLFLIGLLMTMPFHPTRVVGSGLSTDASLRLVAHWLCGAWHNLYDLFADGVCHSAFACHFTVGVYLFATDYRNCLCCFGWGRLYDPGQVDCNEFGAPWGFSGHQTRAAKGLVNRYDYLYAEK